MLIFVFLTYYTPSSEAYCASVHVTYFMTAALSLSLIFLCAMRHSAEVKLYKSAYKLYTVYPLCQIQILRIQIV
jgi:hypothetical protein